MHYRRIKKALFILAFFSAVVIIQKFCHSQTDGFAVCKIRQSFTQQEHPEFFSTSQKADTKLIDSILAKPLRYIGRGGQCYAFATEDDQYVVKLLKYNNNYPKIWFRLFPFPFGLEKYRQEKFEKKAKKLRGEYSSYQIALQDLKEETGIVYFHLHENTLPNVTIQIKDKLNILHVLKADCYQFYIQKKGSSFYPGLLEMIRSGKTEQAKEVLNELVSYLFKRCHKQITDGDDGIHRNFAFQDGHPFQIDIGQFSYNPSLGSSQEQRQDLLFFTKDFHRWLLENSPDLADYLIQSITQPPSS